MRSDGGHLNGMVDVWLARASALVLVRIDGKVESLVDGFEVLRFLAGLPNIDKVLVPPFDFFFFFLGVGVG